MKDLGMLVADMQCKHLEDAIDSFNRFCYYAKFSSRFAIPGESDNALEWLFEVRKKMYPEAVYIDEV